MRVVFVHGWSVTNTDTYGGLPAALAAQADPALAIEVANLYLSEYVSFADPVSVDDIARGLEQAVRTEVLPKLGAGEQFAFITHSTGGPVVRKWLDLYYRGHLAQCPMRHLIMLAPANHGSALAQLGKSRLSRLKFFAEGVQPGTGVLDWLELGSEQSWALNLAWLDYVCRDSGVYAFVLTGQTIDHSFYDSLNAYTGEAGSDGVVRVAAANMNYGLIRLRQDHDHFILDKQLRTEPFALGILPNKAHSGEQIGVMRSVKAGDTAANQPTLEWVLKCLAVDSAPAYTRVADALATLSARTQQDERERKVKELLLFERTVLTSRYSMFVFRVLDDRGNALADYDVTFTAGPDYSEHHLPPGFVVDRQANQLSAGKLTYYIDYDLMAQWLQRPELAGKLGFKIGARPDKGYAYYQVGEYRGTFAELAHYFAPNQTVMVEFQLQRHVAEGVCRLTRNLAAQSFKDQPPGADLPAL